MNDRVLITFVGGHDLTANKNGAIEQLIKYLKPQKVYIFLTKDYEDTFYKNNLQAHYQGMINGDLEVIKTGIENPVDFEEVSVKTAQNISEINEYVIAQKGQAYLNLTSGTPAIISVLALYAITGQLNRAVGMYAPNPQYDNEIKCNALNFYRDSVAYKTVKSLINSMDYIGLTDFIKIKNTFPKLQADKEFINIAEFGRNRILCNFEEADTIYNNSEVLKEMGYSIPKNLYEKAKECYMSAKVSERNNDTFQTIIKLAIVRENLISYLFYESKNAITKELVEFRIDNKTKNKKPYLNKEIMENKYPELRDYLGKKLKLDYDRELTALLEWYILEYLIKEKNNPILNNLAKEVNKLEELRGARNEIAHNIKPPRYNPEWAKSIEKIIKYTAEYTEEQEPIFDAYEILNKLILNKLKHLLSM